MLSVVSFTWYDIVIGFALMAVPFLMGAVIFFLVVKSFKSSISRTILLWLILPQLLATLILWWMTIFYNVYTSPSIFSTASVAMFGGMVICFPLIRKQKPVVNGLIVGHLFALALFFCGINILSPGLYADLQNGREIHQLRNLGSQWAPDGNQRIVDVCGEEK